MWSEPVKIAKWIFHLSYLYLSFTCLIISLVVGLLVSVLTGEQKGWSRKWPLIFSIAKVPDVWHKSVDSIKVVDWSSLVADDQ